MDDDSLLSREELNIIESSQVFNNWLLGLIDERDLTEIEKKAIFAYQVYYDLTLSDDFIYDALDHFRFYGINSLLSNDQRIEVVSIAYHVPKEYIKIKALLMLKREEKEKQKEIKSINLHK